jgi:hypothetical protein
VTHARDFELQLRPHREQRPARAHERRGYRVIAPAYPGFEAEVEALRGDPTPI